MASLFGITADHTDDLGQLREYLRRHGVGEKDVEGAMLAVWLALGRYRENVVAPSDESVRMHVEKIAATAAALLKTIDGADAVDALAWRGLVAPPINFGIDVRFVRDAATDALKRLKVNGRPATAKAILVRELAIIWERATGESPTASGAATFNSPRSKFGNFVALVVADKADNFEPGFADLLRETVKRHRSLRGKTATT